MGSVRWRKVLRDLAVARTRTALVVLSIAVGVFAVGTIAGSSALLRDGLRTAYLASRPASATIAASEFGGDVVQAVREMPGIAGARRGAASPSGCERGGVIPRAPADRDRRLRGPAARPRDAGARRHLAAARGEMLLERSSLTWPTSPRPVRCRSRPSTGRSTPCASPALPRGRGRARLLCRPPQRPHHLRHAGGPRLRDRVRRDADPGQGHEPRPSRNPGHRRAGPGAHGGGRGDGPLRVRAAPPGSTRPTTSSPASSWSSGSSACWPSLPRASWSSTRSTRSSPSRHARSGS